MQKRPRFPVNNNDSPIIATHQLIIIIGPRRYMIDISTRCTELKPSRAEVIPINRQQKGTRKPISK